MLPRASPRWVQTPPRQGHCSCAERQVWSREGAAGCGRLWGHHLGGLPDRQEAGHVLWGSGAAHWAHLPARTHWAHWLPVRQEVRAGREGQLGTDPACGDVGTPLR